MRAEPAACTIVGMLLKPRLLLIVLALAAAFPAAAGADTYCAGTPGCANPSVQAALDAAALHAGPDRVEIGAGTFERQGGFTYAGAEPLELVGMGAGTVLRGLPSPGSEGDTTLTVQHAAVRAFAVDVPAGGDYPGRGLLVEHGSAEDVKVAGAAGGGGIGIAVADAVLRRVDVSGASYGVGGKDFSLLDSRVSSVTRAVAARDGGSLSIARSRLVAGEEVVHLGSTSA